MERVCARRPVLCLCEFNQSHCVTRPEEGCLLRVCTVLGPVGRTHMAKRCGARCGAACCCRCLPCVNNMETLLQHGEVACLYSLGHAVCSRLTEAHLATEAHLQHLVRCCCHGQLPVSHPAPGTVLCLAWGVLPLLPRLPACRCPHPLVVVQHPLVVSGGCLPALCVMAWVLITLHHA